MSNSKLKEKIGDWEKDYDLFRCYVISANESGIRHFSDDPLFQEIKLSIKKYLIQQKQKLMEEIEKVKRDMEKYQNKIEENKELVEALRFFIQDNAFHEEFLITTIIEYLENNNHPERKSAGVN